MTSQSIVPIVFSTENCSERAQNGATLHRPDAPDDGRYVSKAEYWATWYDHGDASYEWNNGYLEAKPLSNQLQLQLYNWFLILLHQFLRAHPIAKMINLETGFSMVVPDPKRPGQYKETVRKPDIGIIHQDNPIPLGDTERSYSGVCDLCVEALSDSAQSEVKRDTVTKLAEYGFAGVREYFILDPSDEYMHFYRWTESGYYSEIVPDATGVIRSSVLPGFQFRLRDLHLLPSLEALALDEVYQGFILPEYQETIEQIQIERMRTDIEAQARKGAEARAEAEAAARMAMEEELAHLRAELAQLRRN